MFVSLDSEEMRKPEDKCSRNNDARLYLVDLEKGMSLIEYFG